MNKLKNIHPIGRTGSPIDVAQLICWLASEEASFVTGQVWTIDGGRMTKLSLPQILKLIYIKFKYKIIEENFVKFF